MKNKNRTASILFKALIPSYFYIFVVLLPVLVVAIYFWFIMTPEYTSVSQSIILTQASNNTLKPSQQLLADLGGDPATVNLLKSYITSDTMLNTLNEKLGLENYFKSKKIDFISRLRSRATQQRWLNYFSEKINMDYSDEDNVLSLSVSAFDPKMAQAIANEILLQSNIFLNKLNDAANQNEFTTAKEDLNEDKKQILHYSASTTNQFSSLDLKFLTHQYETDFSRLHTAKLNLINNASSLMVIIPPSLPDGYSSPRKGYDLVALFIALSLIYALGKMLVIIVNEHKD